MIWDNRKWVIITLDNYNEEQLQELVDNAIQTSIKYLRKSVDETKAILKWDGDTPDCFDGMTTYSHSEIREELTKSDWSE